MKSSYYPLKTGNHWKYQFSNGDEYTLKIISEENGIYQMHNSFDDTTTPIKREGSKILGVVAGSNELKERLNEDLLVGDTWEFEYQANGIDNVLRHSIKDQLSYLEVNGKTYQDVLVVEAELLMVISGNLTAINYFTQYYYAKGVGNILTTTSQGDRIELVAYQVS